MATWRLPPVGGFTPRDVEPYDADRRAGEALVFGLRMARGVDLDRLARRHGPEPVPRRALAIESVVQRGLLLREGPGIRLTDQAVLIANEALTELL